MAMQLKSASDIMLMRESCRLAAQTLTMVSSHVVAGVTTWELDRMCHEFILDHHAIPSPLNYRGFPKSICTSINDVVCHGIPDQTVLVDGDILNIDVTVYKNGFHGDTSRMFLVGEVSPARLKLVEMAQKCLQAGIGVVRPGARLGDIGQVIQTLAESAGYGVVREYCGHGVGREFHEDPAILHFGKAGTGQEIVEGMVFTIEPMINTGSWKTRLMKDGWTVKTIDGGDSAQFEHTMAVTRWGVEVLT
jgi:methionyl aminopeptidase